MREVSDGQRGVMVRVLTPAGWFSGAVQVPERSSVVDHLNRSGGLVRMTNVTLQGHDEPVPFLAVRRDSMRIVLPPLVETESPEPQQSAAHEVAGVLPGLLFQGRVRLAAGQRVSDFFAAAKGFVRVSDCRLHVGDPRLGEVDKSDEKEILVHAPSLIAVSDTLG